MYGWTRWREREPGKREPGKAETRKSGEKDVEVIVPRRSWQIWIILPMNLGMEEEGGKEPN